jgi:Antibiotic biosynthesis monooxygenase
VYAAIRQSKARAGAAEELARRVKEGAIPIISDVPGFMGYYVVYAPDDTVVAISIFNSYEGAEESNKRALAWIEENLGPLLVGPATALAGPVIVPTFGIEATTRRCGQTNLELAPHLGRGKLKGRHRGAAR